MDLALFRFTRRAGNSLSYTRGSQTVGYPPGGSIVSLGETQVVYIRNICI
jgi:hypothetical protein